MDILENIFYDHGQKNFPSNYQGSEKLFLLYLSQLLLDSLKVLGTPRVKTKSAAWVHLGERHLLRRRAMKRLDRKPTAYFRRHAPR